MDWYKAQSYPISILLKTMNPEKLFLPKLLPPSGQEMLTTCFYLAPATAMLAYSRACLFSLWSMAEVSILRLFLVPGLPDFPSAPFLRLGLPVIFWFCLGETKRFLLVSFLAVWPRKIIVPSRVLSLLML